MVLEVGNAPVANKPRVARVGGEMTSLLRTFATSSPPRHALPLPIPPAPPSFAATPRRLARGSCSLRRAQIRISSRRSHILKMSAPIYGRGRSRALPTAPRIQIVLFFDSFSRPENRVTRLYPTLQVQTNKHRPAWRSEKSDVVVAPSREGRPRAKAKRMERNRILLIRCRPILCYVVTI